MLIWHSRSHMLLLSFGQSLLIFYVLPSSKSLPKVENDPFYDVSLFWTHSHLMLRYQNGYIAIIFLCMTDNFALKFDFNLFMFDIKVLTNGVQFLTNYHENNVAIIHFKNYLLKSSFEYIYIIINLVFQGWFFFLWLFGIFQFSYTTSCFSFSVIREKDKKIPLDTPFITVLGKPAEDTMTMRTHAGTFHLDLCIYGKLNCEGKVRERKQHPHNLMTTRVSQDGREICFTLAISQCLLFPRGQQRKQVMILPLLLGIPNNFSESSGSFMKE